MSHTSRIKKSVTDVHVLDRTAGAFVVPISFSRRFVEGFVDFAVLIWLPLVRVRCDSVDFAFKCTVGSINVWVGNLEEWHSQKHMIIT